MALPLRHQWRLRRIEYALHQSDPAFVTLIDNFATFGMDGRVPGYERLKPHGVWRHQGINRAFLRIALLFTRYWQDSPCTGTPGLEASSTHDHTLP